VTLAAAFSSRAPSETSASDAQIERPRYLRGVRNRLAIVTAVGEQPLGMGFLKVSAANLPGGNVSGDGQHGHTAAMAVVETVDQVQVPGAAAASAHAELARQMRFSARGECPDLFVADVDPCDVVATEDRVRDPVEGIAGYAVDPLDAHFREDVHDHLCDGLFRHALRLSRAPKTRKEGCTTGC
jgi:hypothetical protein